MRNVDAVTFDFFQTLARHRGGVGRGRAILAYLESQGMRPRSWEHGVLCDVLRSHALDYSPDDSPRQKRAYLVELTRRVLERLGVSTETHPPVEHAESIWELIGPASLEVYPEVPRALGRLRAAGYRLVVISNWQSGLAHFCTELGIGGYFEHVLASAEVGHEKPGREIFREAARRLDVRPDRILHVGDSPEEDVGGARAAGMHALLLDRTAARPSSAEAVIRNLDEVADRLLRARAAAETIGHRAAAGEGDDREVGRRRGSGGGPVRRPPPPSR